MITEKIILVGKPAYIEAFAKSSEGHYFTFINSTDKDFISKKNWSTLSKHLLNESLFIGFISLPSGFIHHNASTIADFREYIRSKKIKIKKTFCLPLHLAEVVDNKFTTYNHFSKVDGIFQYIPHFLDTNADIPKFMKPPFVFKNFYESGGRGNKLLQKEGELLGLSSSEGFISEFINGLEVTQTLVVLNKKIIFLPQTWKNITTMSLTHSDQKPKFAGIFHDHFKIIDLANKIVGDFGSSHNYILSLQAVVENQNDCKLLELESRLTGSTPIMEAVYGSSINEIVNEWLTNETTFDTKTKSQKSSHVACQFISYSDQTKNLKANYIIQIKPEYDTLLKKNKYRISFKAQNISKLLRYAHEIGENIGDNNFGNTIEQHFHEINNYLRSQ